MGADVTTTVEEVLRKINELSGTLGNEGINLPELTQTAQALSEMRQPEREERIVIVQPEEPAFNLDPSLQPRWDAFDEFWVALKQRFGYANNDQAIMIAMIAATLAIGGTPSSVMATWPTFIEYLQKLTTDLLGTLTADQYMTALDVAARLVSGAGGGGTSTLPDPPATGGPFGWSSDLNQWVIVGAGTGIGEAPNTPGTFYLRDGSTNSWNPLVDGGQYV